MKKYRELLFVLVLIALSATAVLVANVWAATEASVTATVTAQNISIGVSSGTVAYGTLAIGSSANTNALGQTQTAINQGNVAEDIDIRGQDSNPGSWTLAASTGSQDEYVHEFCTSNCDTSPSWTPMDTSGVAMFTSVGAGSSNPFDLQIKTPSSTNDYTEQGVDVTIVASSAG